MSGNLEKSLKPSATRTIAHEGQSNSIEAVVDEIRNALISVLRETGHAHIEIDCSITNMEKEVVRVVLMARGTKRSLAVSRKPPKHYSFVGIAKSGKGSLSTEVDANLDAAANRREGWSLS